MLKTPDLDSITSPDLLATVLCMQVTSLYKIKTKQNTRKEDIKKQKKNKKKHTKHIKQPTETKQNPYGRQQNALLTCWANLWFTLVSPPPRNDYFWLPFVGVLFWHLFTELCLPQFSSPRQLPVTTWWSCSSADSLLGMQHWLAFGEQFTYWVYPYSTPVWEKLPEVSDYSHNFVKPFQLYIYNTYTDTILFC